MLWVKGTCKLIKRDGGNVWIVPRSLVCIWIDIILIHLIGNPRGLITYWDRRVKE